MILLVLQGTFMISRRKEKTRKRKKKTLKRRRMQKNRKNKLWMKIKK